MKPEKYVTIAQIDNRIVKDMLKDLDPRVQKPYLQVSQTDSPTQFRPFVSSDFDPHNLEYVVFRGKGDTMISAWVGPNLKMRMNGDRLDIFSPDDPILQWDLDTSDFELLLRTMNEYFHVKQTARKYAEALTYDVEVGCYRTVLVEL